MLTRTRVRALLLIAFVSATLLASCGTGGTDGTAETSQSPPPTPTPTIQAEWEIYESVEELAGAADVVVVGIVGTELGRYPHFEQGVDVEPALTKILHRVSVLDVVASKSSDSAALQSGDQIVVSYSDLGALVGNITPYKVGETLVFFLDASTFESPGLETVDGWEPLSSDSGIFEIDSQTLIARTDVGPMKGESFESTSFFDSVRHGMSSAP